METGVSCRRLGVETWCAEWAQCGNRSVLLAARSGTRVSCWGLGMEPGVCRRRLGVETVVRCRGLRVEAGPAAGDSEWKHGCVAGWLGVETGMCCRGLRVEAGCAAGGSEWKQVSDVRWIGV